MPDRDTTTATLEALLDAAVDAIIVADKDGRIVRVNPAACQLFGYDVNELTGASIDILVPDPDLPPHSKIISRHIETGIARIIGTGRDVDALRKDGSIFPVHISVGRCDAGNGPMFVGVLHDLTARQASQRALELSQRMDALGQLTGGVAHDFNNILTIIIGNLELLSARLEASENRVLVDEAMAAAQLGSDLIGTLLTHGGHGQLHANHLNINEIVEETRYLLERTLAPNVRIETVFESAAWKIEADSTQLRTALINLAVNAQDAMPDGGTIVLRTSNVTIDDYLSQQIGIGPGDYVRISVTDNGQGMLPEVREHAFEPFFTTKGPGKGTGLGLATVYGFARQSGGLATLYSEVGLGTTVSLYFPVAAGDGASTASTPPESPAEAARSNSGQTILVVEDDAAIRRLSVSRIEAMGYQVLSAADAAEALTILANTPAIDALFTDIVMPGKMSGLDLANKVRAERPDIAILLTSGFSGDLIQPQKAGADQFPMLHKPYRQHELAVHLRVLLSGRTV